MPQKAHRDFVGFAFITERTVSFPVSVETSHAPTAPVGERHRNHRAGQVRSSMPVASVCGTTNKLRPRPSVAPDGTLPGVRSLVRSVFRPIIFYFKSERQSRRLSLAFAGPKWNPERTPLWSEFESLVSITTSSLLRNPPSNSSFGSFQPHRAFLLENLCEKLSEQQQDQPPMNHKSPVFFPAEFQNVGIARPAGLT